jgi:hypothetical protein
VDEQAKVMGRLVSPGQPISPSGESTETSPEETGEQPQAAAEAEAPAGTEGEEGEPAPPEVQQSKVGEVDVIRPVISQTTLDAAQNMTPQGAAAASLADSENIASDLPGGLTALASISAVNDPSVASSKPRLPLAQRPYYRVLIKGEQLKPKAGRADDFTWPRS